MGRLRDLGRPRTYPKSPKRFPILLADPPWTFKNNGRGIVASGIRSPEHHYPCMETDEICALPVKGIAAKDAVLFLWTTSAHLPQAIKVMESWGFSYKTKAVWTKDKFSFGYYFRQQHDTLLLGEKGNFRCPKPANRPSSVIEAPRRGHSQKPDEAYELIETMYPGIGPKLELFARNTRPGWHVWGNEVANSVKLPWKAEQH